MDDYDMDYEPDEDDLPKRNPVYCDAVGGELDLDAEDLGYPEVPDLWEQLRADKRPVPERGLWCPDCARERPSQREWMVLVLRAGVRSARHHNPNRKAHSLNETPEHQAYKERILRAAEEGGFRVEDGTDSVDRRLKCDVRVEGAGGTIFGFETRLKYEGAPLIQGRDRARRENGITPVWHVTDRNAPLIDRVQWCRTDHLPARAIRNSRDLLVRGGVRELAEEKCDHRSPRPCPIKGGGRCGQWHPRWEPRGRQLDDLVRDIASREYVPLVERVRGRIWRFWAPIRDRSRYIELGGQLLADDSGEASAEVSPLIEGARRRDALCVRDRASTFIPTRSAPRDGGEVLQPPLTIGSANPRPEAPGHPRHFSDLTFAEVVAVAREYGCSPIDVGPCGRCYGPTKRYGEHARVLCGTCRPM
jgi:hypothetical protein